MAKPQTSAVKSRFSIKRHRDKKIRLDWQAVNAKHRAVSRLAGSVRGRAKNAFCEVLENHR
jgi:hypothetical protein